MKDVSKMGDKSCLLKAHHSAQQISERLVSAFWADSMAQHLVYSAHEELEILAARMGYRLITLEEDEAVAEILDKVVTPVTERDLLVPEDAA